MPLSPVVPMPDEQSAAASGAMQQATGGLRLADSLSASSPPPPQQQQQQQVHEALEEDPADISQIEPDEQATAEREEGASDGGESQLEQEMALQALNMHGQSMRSIGGGGGGGGELNSNQRQQRQLQQLSGAASLVLNVPPPGSLGSFEPGSSHELQSTPVEERQNFDEELSAPARARPSQSSGRQSRLSSQAHQMVEFARIGSAGYLSPGLQHGAASASPSQLVGLVRKSTEGVGLNYYRAEGPKGEMGSGSSATDKHEPEADEAADDEVEEAESERGSERASLRSMRAATRGRGRGRRRGGGGGGDNPAHAGKYIIS